MADAKFVLKEPESKDQTLIYLLFSFNGQRLKYSTGQKINPKFWNPEKQRVKESRLFPEHEGFNVLLDKLATNVKIAYRDILNAGSTPTTYRLKDELNKIMFKEEYTPKLGFLRFVEELVQTSDRKPNTRRQWGQTLRKLQEYRKATQKEVDFDTINLDFYNSFIAFLTREGYTKNSIGGFIKNVKIFMNEAVDRGLTHNLEYRNRKFKVLEEQVDKIYLTQKELQKLYSLDLSGRQKLEKVRDLFLIACYTGLRFSDLIQVCPENIVNGGHQIRIRTEKTGEIVVIPLHPIVRQIIENYGGRLPPVISNQKMNQYLKEIGKEAEILDTTQISITRGGKTDKMVNKKYELITTHTARRSFATNAYLNDVPTISIMKITGHKTEKSFLKYIRISQEDNANKLVNHPFFN
jgi:integrase